METIAGIFAAVIGLVLALCSVRIESPKSVFLEYHVGGGDIARDLDGHLGKEMLRGRDMFKSLHFVDKLALMVTGTGRVLIVNTTYNYGKNALASGNFRGHIWDGIKVGLVNHHSVCSRLLSVVRENHRLAETFSPLAARINRCSGNRITKLLLAFRGFSENGVPIRKIYLVTERDPASHRMADVLYVGTDVYSRFASLRKDESWWINSKCDRQPRPLYLFKLFAGNSSNGRGGIRGFDHFLPLVDSSKCVGQDDEECAEGNPKSPSLPKPPYCLSPLFGTLLLGLGFWYLNYGDDPGGNVVFILANAAIPIGATLCLYRLNGLLNWSVRF